MQRKTLHATDGETLKVSNQWAAETEKRGTTVSASAWEFSGSGTIASETLATPLATCLLTPTSCGTVKNTVTLANGEVLIATRKVSMPVPRTLDYQ
jgi:hypothetical protein